MSRRLLLLLVVVASVIAFVSGRASAHNSLVSSTPADGAVLDAAPIDVAWVFANSVPLDTLTVTLVDAAGVRTEIAGSTHGANGTNEVVTPLPPLPSGATTLRWRLVGPDGHPVTGRVSFTITAAPEAVPTTVPTTTSTPAATPASTSTPTPPSSATDSTDDVEPVATAGFDDEGSGPSSALRWMLRVSSYVSIMVAAGVVMTRAFVWRGTSWDRDRRWLGRALVATAVLALVQLLVVAADISGGSMFGSFAEIDAAMSTHAGVALLVRLSLAALAWLLVVHDPPNAPDVRSAVLVLLSLCMLGTWSFAGHSRSMRWPAIGVPVDMVHHGAAAAWLGGLVLLGLAALGSVAADDLGPTMRRFSRTAEISVALIVATGLIQAVRLVGNPAEVFAASHGTLLVVKVVLLAGMLFAARRNRQHVLGLVRSAGAAADPDVGSLRRAMVIELVIGFAIIGVTAAMVVSPPGTAS